MYKLITLESYPPLYTIFSLIHQEDSVAFLDSSLQNELGRYSILGRSPYLQLVQGEAFTVNGQPCEIPFQEYLKRYLKEHHAENTHPEVPLISGGIGYFSYDYGREYMGIPSQWEKNVEIPEAVWTFYDQFLIEDHQTHRLYLIANDHLQSCEEGLAELQQLVAQATTVVQEEVHGSPSAVRANFTKEDYMDAVNRLIAYIVEGDVYIANMTQQLLLESNLTPYDLFCILREKNPSPFGGFLQYRDFQVVSASPERFLQMRNGLIETRPIKGTRKRGATVAEDNQMRKELEQSEKDRSELLMIVDLERNDLNRVCVPGSVTVRELFAVEAYATVFHLVATVTGQLRPELDVVDLLDAVFPGGSITGAPKYRAMEIIDELEHSRRNLYTGSMGYLSLNGDCDLNIIIRTALHRNGTYHLGVGGGITCESEPEFEYEETLQKAKAIVTALNGTFPGEGEESDGTALR